MSDIWWTIEAYFPSLPKAWEVKPIGLSHQSCSPCISSNFLNIKFVLRLAVNTNRKCCKKDWTATRLRKIKTQQAQFSIISIVADCAFHVLCWTTTTHRTYSHPSLALSTMEQIAFKQKLVQFQFINIFFFHFTISSIIIKSKSMTD